MIVIVALFFYITHLTGIMSRYNERVGELQGNIRKAQAQGRENARIAGLKYCKKNWDKMLAKEIKSWRRVLVASTLSESSFNNMVAKSQAERLFKIYGYTHQEQIK